MVGYADTEAGVSQPEHTNQDVCQWYLPRVQSFRWCPSVFLLLFHTLCFPPSDVRNLLKGTMLESTSKNPTVIISELGVGENKDQFYKSEVTAF